jgi:ketosteroid isomerase-like protein
MYAWLVERLVRRNFGHFNRGDASGVLARFADDVHFRFGGAHALGIDSRSKADVERWFARVFELLPGVRFEVEEVVVAGPPWNLRFCTRYTVRKPGAGDEPVYRAVQIARVRWGRVVEDLIYPDTQAVAAYLGVLGAGPNAPASKSRPADAAASRATASASSPSSG